MDPGDGTGGWESRPDWPIIKVIAAELETQGARWPRAGADCILRALHRGGMTVRPDDTISTDDQLNVLPFLTIVRSVRASPSGTDYGAVWERRMSGWACIAGASLNSTRPQCPARVLWLPANA